METKKTQELDMTFKLNNLLLYLQIIYALQVHEFYSVINLKFTVFKTYSYF